MSKPLKHILLPAYDQGWELWLLSEESSKLVESYDEINKSTLLPKGTSVAFPAHSVTIIPLSIASEDLETQKGIAQLQMEQNGLLKSGAASWDVFPVDTESSLYAGVSLIDDLKENFDHLADISFNLAARFYEVDDVDCIVCTKEQGRFVIIFYKKSHPFYTEILDSLESFPALFKSLAIQFSILELSYLPQKIIIEAAAISDDDSQNIENFINHRTGLPVKIIEKIDISNSELIDLQLVPLTATKVRNEKKRNKKTRLYIIIALSMYVIGGMFLYYQYKQRENQIQQIENEVAALEPRWIEYQQNLSKLNELDNLLTNQWPLASFEKVVSHLPSHQELRFQVVEIQSGNILIKGVSPNINLINALHPALIKDPYFKEYTWKVPVKEEDQKTKLWNFTIQAMMKEGV